VLLRAGDPLKQIAGSNQVIDPGSQLLVGVGLGQIVVRAGRQPVDQLSHFMVRSQQQNREVRRGAARRAEEAADVQSGHRRHDPVEDEDVGNARAAGELLQHRGSVVEDAGLVASRERAIGAVRIERAVIHHPHETPRPAA
jgi:hypothetical protein